MQSARAPPNLEQAPLLYLHQMTCPGSNACIMDAPIMHRQLHLSLAVLLLYSLADPAPAPSVLRSYISSRSSMCSRPTHTYDREFLASGAPLPPTTLAAVQRVTLS